jgi:hypothetical protein
MGIQELRYLDPRKTRKVRTVDQTLDPTGNVMYETKREFFVYSDNGTTNNQPQLRINVAGNGLEIFHNHASTYNIKTIVTTFRNYAEVKKA